METNQPPELTASNTMTELANQSNEQLLQKLAQSVESRRRHRNKQKIVYAGYFLVCGAGGILMTLAPLLNIMPSLILFTQIPSFALVIAFLAFITWFNRSFYRRTAQQRDAAVLELARRGEERALGPLLELMDMRMSGSSKNWGASRVVFIEAMDLLLARVTPASFADLSDAQIHQLSPLLLLPEPELQTIISAALCRSGDARALRSLRKYEGMYRLQRWQKFNPFLVVVKISLRRSKMPLLDKESIEIVTRCCQEIEPRVEAEQRMAQLLRASHSENEQPSNQLLRGAMPTVATEPVEQLLHPALTGTVNDVGALIADEEMASRAAHSVLPPTFQTHAQPEATEEVNLRRG